MTEKTRTSFLKAHNPFTNEENQHLRNTARGLIAGHRVNVDDAVNKLNKQKHQSKLNEKKLGDIILKRSDQAITFPTMWKAIKIFNDEVHMSSEELYHYLLFVVYKTGC